MNQIWYVGQQIMWPMVVRGLKLWRKSYRETSSSSSAYTIHLERERERGRELRVRERREAMRMRRSSSSEGEYMYTIVYRACVRVFSQ